MMDCSSEPPSKQPCLHTDEDAFDDTQPAKYYIESGCIQESETNCNKHFSCVGLEVTVDNGRVSVRDTVNDPPVLQIDEATIVWIQKTNSDDYDETIGELDSDNVTEASRAPSNGFLLQDKNVHECTFVAVAYPSKDIHIYAFCNNVQLEFFWINICQD